MIWVRIMCLSRTYLKMRELAKKKKKEKKCINVSSQNILV